MDEEQHDADGMVALAQLTAARAQIAEGLGATELIPDGYTIEKSQSPVYPWKARADLDLYHMRRADAIAACQKHAARVGAAWVVLLQNEIQNNRKLSEEVDRLRKLVSSESSKMDTNLSNGASESVILIENLMSVVGVDSTDELSDAITSMVMDKTVAEHGDLEKRVREVTDELETAKGLVNDLMDVVGVGTVEELATAVVSLVRRQKVADHWDHGKRRGPADHGASRRVPGGWSGRVNISDDFDAPLPESVENLFCGAGSMVRSQKEDVDAPLDPAPERTTEDGNDWLDDVIGPTVEVRLDDVTEENRRLKDEASALMRSGLEAHRVAQRHEELRRQSEALAAKRAEQLFEESRRHLRVEGLLQDRITELEGQLETVTREAVAYSRQIADLQVSLTRSQAGRGQGVVQANEGGLKHPIDGPPEHGARRIQGFAALPVGDGDGDG